MRREGPVQITREHRAVRISKRAHSTLARACLIGNFGKMLMGSISLALGLAFFTASVGFVPSFLRSDLSLMAVFLLFIISLVPFIATYTKLGLNGEKESDENRKQLSRYLPYWESVLVCGGIIGVGLTISLNRFIHPVYAFMAGGSFLSAYWFLHVYPVAKKVLAEPAQPPKAGDLGG